LKRKSIGDRSTYIFDKNVWDEEKRFKHLTMFAHLHRVYKKKFRIDPAAINEAK